MKFILTYARRKIWLAVSFLILNIGGWAMVTATAIYTQRLVDLIIVAERAQFMQELIRAAIFTIAAGAVYYLGEIAREMFSAYVSKAARKDLYHAIMRRTKSDYESQDTAAYMSVISNDVDNFSGIINMSKMLIMGFSGIATALVIMAFYNWMLTAVSIAISALTIVLPMAFTKAMQRRQLAMTQCQSDFNIEMKEIFSGYEEITSLNLLMRFAKRFDICNMRLAKADYRLNILRSGTSSAGQMIGVATRLIMVLVAGILVINSSITIGTFVLFTALQSTFSGGAVMIMQIMPIISSMMPVQKKLNEYLSYENNDFSGVTPPTFTGQIKISNLSFSYNEDKPVLQNFSADINKNEKLALIGPSGSGKTTLVNLLCGKYANFQGEICYDGTPLHSLATEKLCTLITVIHQNVYIFNDTLRYNIALGESFDESDWERALRLSGVNKFIDSISGGLDGACGERGVNLSGGQKQRVAIARALIRGVKFIVLDEGISAVDIETANAIEQELLNIPDLTLLTITHRIKDGLIDKYDRTIKLEESKQ